ncbi:MAG: Penicillin-binding protein 2 [Parcubacteria group bacterium Gr01-1014_56]|nr:MAG: Penicillin-binding protein 2 [Parcubacteria group bacterium Gr01-1014_56]
MFWRGGRKLIKEIEADEILIDSSNLPSYDTDQFEGRIEQPIGRPAILTTLGVVFLIMFLYAGRGLDLQFLNGAAYAKQAAENQLTEKIIFADRGVLEDRRGIPLAYNTLASTTDDFAQRTYAPFRGLAHIVGYVKSPQKDSSGFYFRTSFEGIDGLEKTLNAALQGQNGITLTETDAKGRVVSESARMSPIQGAKVRLSIDAKFTQGLYDAIEARAEASGFQGGSGVIMDIETGEIIALTSYPEYSTQALSEGNKAALEVALSDTRQPFLNRAVNGLYAPGSIVKPFMGVAALTEGVIDENKQIVSTGSISLPNPYNPDQPSVFKDWRAHGWVDLRRAIAVSSDVYFYEIGGGYQNQPGLGIDRIDKYFRLFGFGSVTGLLGFDEPTGTIPTPEWKLETFDNDPWRVGDTYHTVIGQYGLQITPLQAVRAMSALANGGKLLTPTLIASSSPKSIALNLPQHNLDVAKEGMRMSVVEGIATAVNFSGFEVAAKTGTAQVGLRNQYINSWMIGFFPYEKPRYAFAIVLERGPAATLVGASATAGDFLRFLQAKAPEYTK